MKILVIYHNNCADGFLSAHIAHLWSLKEKDLGLDHEMEYVACNYGEDYSVLEEKVKDRNVIVLDFSFKRPLMLKLHSLAKSFEVYDHHKTARDECTGLDFCYFDMTHSGAYLAWKRFFPNDVAMPKIVAYVQDRDLWAWVLPDSKRINAVIQATEKTFEAYCALTQKLEHQFEAVNAHGNIILEQEIAHVKNAIKYSIPMSIGGYVVPVINNPNLISVSVEALAENLPFAGAFFLRTDGRWQFSLRSRSPNGIDVSEIARVYGGGGHKNAASFECDFDQLKIFLEGNGPR